MTTLIALLLFAQVETDAKRYHDAYVLEVIEGKPAEAAKQYLALMEDEDANARLRLQAELRFAVCCALLGRADEARARLARLAADPDLPDALKPQVEEYRKSLSDVGRGSALDAKLEELTLELAKIPAFTSGHPEIYRVFSALGDPAVPHLKSLLDHRDQGLRNHAWRILSAMNVPDLVALWDPERRNFREFTQYLMSDPKRMQAFEARLRSLDPKDAARNVARLGLDAVALDADSPISTSFARWLVEGGAAQIGMRVLRPRTRETEALVLEWMTSGTRDQQLAAARYYGLWAAGDSSMRRPPDLFPKYIDLLIAGRNSVEGIYEYACAVPVPDRLDALDRLLDAGVLFGPFFSEIAASIEKDAESPEEIARYRSLLVRSVEGINRLYAADRRRGWTQLAKDDSFEDHLRWVAVRSPATEVKGLVQALAKHARAQDVLETVLGFERPEDAGLIRAAMPHVEREELAKPLYESTKPHRHPDPAYLEAVAPLWPHFIVYGRTTNSVTPTSRMRSSFEELATRLSRPVARRVLRAILEKSKDSGIPAGVGYFFPSPSGAKRHPRYAHEIAFPVLDFAWSTASGDERCHLINFAIGMTFVGGVPEKTRDAARAFIVSHAGDVPDGRVFQVDWGELINHPERLAPELWIPFISPTRWSALRQRTPFVPEFPVAAARGFAARPELLNGNAIEFVGRYVPSDEVRKLAEPLVRSSEDEQLVASIVRNDLECAVEIREERLHSELEEGKTPDPGLVLMLARSVIHDRPSDKHIPVVEWLLARPERYVRLGAIGLADSLGSEKLVPPMLPLLDSLDENVRERAKNTIDSILANRRIKEEVEARLR